MSLHRPLICAALAAAIGLGVGAPAVAADSSTFRLAQAGAPQIRADDLVGKTVRNPAGDKIGEVDSVLLGNDGRTAALVIGVGGFLGLGERNVAVPMNRFTFVQGGDSIGLNATKDELKAMAEYKYRDEKVRRSAFRDPAYAGTNGVATRPGGPAPVVEGGRPAPDRTAGDRRRGWNEAVGPRGEIRASKFVGTKVMNASNEAIGEIDELLIGRGGALQAVLSVGGFLGMGERHVLVDWKQLAIEGKGDKVRVTSSLTKDQLKALPEYK